jgi:putative sterol carrier protein
VPIAFSDEWARAWCEALNASEAYRAAAAAWEGSVALAATTADGSGGPAVFLDLRHGSCLAARAASPEDVAGATYLIEAQPATWRDVLAAQTSPLMALMTGRLKLTRGEMAKLMPHANSARELLHLAGAVETDFPDGW